MHDDEQHLVVGRAALLLTAPMLAIEQTLELQVPGIRERRFAFRHEKIPRFARLGTRTVPMKVYHKMRGNHGLPKAGHCWPTWSKHATLRILAVHAR
jgi:hypothetical protein